MSFILFRYLNNHGMLRVPQEAELAGMAFQSSWLPEASSHRGSLGLDSHEHGGSAYAMTDPSILNAYSLNLQELAPTLEDDYSSDEIDEE